MTMFKVQSGVPLPEISRAPKTPRRKFPVQGMAPGQMFFVPGKTSKSVSAYISRITKNLPGKYTARQTTARLVDEDWMPCAAAHPDAVVGVGVWRLTAEQIEKMEAEAREREAQRQQREARRIERAQAVLAKASTPKRPRGRPKTKG